MPTVESQRAKRGAVLSDLATQRFAYPSADHPNWETFVNFPEPQLGVELKSGGWIYPDVLVAEEPGHFVQALAIVHEPQFRLTLSQIATLCEGTKQLG